MSSSRSAVDATASVEPMTAAEPSGTACRGTVKWFDAKKGFGFILNPDGKDVFVHFSSIEGDGFRVLRDGETVQYEEMAGEKGLLARRVRRSS
jgi:CspA family cold shock protein